MQIWYSVSCCPMRTTSDSSVSPAVTLAAMEVSCLELLGTACPPSPAVFAAVSSCVAVLGDTGICVGVSTLVATGGAFAGVFARCEFLATTVHAIPASNAISAAIPARTFQGFGKTALQRRSKLRAAGWS